MGWVCGTKQVEEGGQGTKYIFQCEYRIRMVGCVKIGHGWKYNGKSGESNNLTKVREHGWW